MARAAFHDAPAAGVTLFRHDNVGSPAQVRELSAALQRAAAGGLDRSRTRRPGFLLIAADQEGGQLNGLGEATTQFAGNMALGAVGDEALTERVRAVGVEARALGGTASMPRSWTWPANRATARSASGRSGDDPAAVGRHGAAMVRGCCRGPGWPRRSSAPVGAVLQDTTWVSWRAGARNSLSTSFAPFPGGDRGRGQGGDVGSRRGARADRRSDAAGDALAGRDERPAARRVRVRWRDHQRRPEHAGTTRVPPQAVGIVAAIRAGEDLAPDRSQARCPRRVEATLRAAAARGLFDADDLAASKARLAALRAWLADAGDRPDLDVVAGSAHRRSRVNSRSAR